MELKYYIQKSLAELGLSGGEAKVYCELLKRPGTDAMFLKKLCRFSTAGIYKILNILMAAGFVSAVKDGRAMIYFPSCLSQISGSLDRKGHSLARISAKLKELERLKNLPEQIEVYENDDLADYYLNIPYKIDDFIWCVGSFEAVVNFFGQEIEHEFINSRIKRGKAADAIIFDTSSFSKNLAVRDKQEKRETKFIQNGQYPLEFSYLFGDTYLNFYRDSEGKVKVLKAESPELARAKNIQYQTLWHSTVQ